MHKPKEQILVIFGASGDLTSRKLVPAIFDLYMQDLLPTKFVVLGTSRSELSDETFRNNMKEGIAKYASFSNIPDEKLNNFLKILYYLPINTEYADDYEKLKIRLQEIDQKYETGGNYVFYLSTPPSMYPVISQSLKKQGLNKGKNAFRRIVVEKPFGIDLNSAIALNKSLLENYDENQIYRIDHYLGKESVQNLLVTRFANSIYEPLWNRNYIQHVEITSAESIGVENRGGYYDTAGALRDMVQNHILQVVALIAMEPPTEISSLAIRNEKLKVFQSLRPFSKEDLTKNIIRGQYVGSTIKNVHQKGYREEVNVNPQSKTETYLAMKIFIDNWRWGGVPFYLRTGKKLPTRVSEIVIHFKPTPNKLFVDNKEFCNTGNQLVLRIQPDEGVLLKTGMKVPGAGYQVQNTNMEFHYKNMEDTYIPGDYERLILDCMNGDSTLYTRGDALEDSWRFVQPIIDFWKNNPDTPLYGYPCGTWGPEETDKLMGDNGETWRYPCKNLSNDGVFCEL